MATSKGLSIREYARHRRAAGLKGGTPSAVHKAIQVGRIRRDESGLIDPVQADAAWEATTDATRGDGHAAPSKLSPAVSTLTRPQSTAPATPTGAPPYATSRAVREAYAAKLTRIEYEEKSGNLVDAARVRSETFRRNRQTRDAILAVPGRLAAILAAESDAAVIEARLTEELTAALEALADE